MMNLEDIISKATTSPPCSKFYVNNGVTITYDKIVLAEKNNALFINVRLWLRKTILLITIANRLYDQTYQEHASITDQSVWSYLYHQISHPGWDSIWANVIKLFIATSLNPWWRHQMETFSALLAICAENSPIPGELPAQRPVTRSFDVFFDLRPNKRLSKQSWGWWFETPSCPLWRHCNVSWVLCIPLLHTVHSPKELGLALINNYIHYNVWDVITYQFLNFNGATVEA